VCGTPNKGLPSSVEIDGAAAALLLIVGFVLLSKPDRSRRSHSDYRNGNSDQSYYTSGSDSGGSGESGGVDCGGGAGGDGGGGDCGGGGD